MTSARQALEVIGRLEVDLKSQGEHHLAIEMRGDTIVIVLDKLSAAFALLQNSPLRGNRVKLLDNELRNTGLSLVVQIDQLIVGKLGRESRAGLFEKLFRLAPLQVFLGSVLRLMAREP